MADLLDQTSVFAVYDLAIYRWVASVLKEVDDPNHPTTTVMAGPQRLYSDAYRILAEQNRLNRIVEDPEKLRPRELLAMLPLPLLGITRGAWVPRMEQRVCTAFGFRNRRFTDSSGTYNLGGKPPLPITLDYQLDLVTEKVSTASRILTAFQQRFDPTLTHGEVQFVPGGQKWKMPILLEGVANNSGLDGGEKDREIRFTLTLKVEGWIQQPVVESRVAKDSYLEAGLEHTDFGEVVLPDHKFTAAFIQQPSTKAWWKFFSYKGKLIYHPVEVGEVPAPKTLHAESTYFVLPGAFTLKEPKFGVVYEPSVDGMVGVTKVFTADYSDPLVVHATQKLWIPRSSGGFGELTINTHGELSWVQRWK